MRWIACFTLVGLALSAPAGSDRKAELVELGRRLFMDPAVSRSGTKSCASCHDPEHGFSDRRELSEDVTGKTRRHSQTLLDLDDGTGMHWDGEFFTVRELLSARLAEPSTTIKLARELRTRHFNRAQTAGRNPDRGRFQTSLCRITPYGGRDAFHAPAPERLAAAGAYDLGFRRAFGSKKITTERIIDALEAYTLSLRSGESPYDRYVAGDPEALTPAQRRGLALFTGKANCGACHLAEANDGGRARFTDDVFHNTGVTFRNVELSFTGNLKGDGGLGDLNFVQQDLGKFKTPTLRDVARRGPFMHDGSLKTLEEVVRYYDDGGTKNTHLDPAVRPLDLSDREVEDLVAFLESLTSDERPGLGDVPAHRSGLTRVQIVDLHGKPLKGLEVEVQSAGDRLRGARGPDRLHLKTDSAGRIEFPFPHSTHARIAAKGYAIGSGGAVPDYARSVRLTATGFHEIALDLTGPARVRRMPKRVAAYRGDDVVALFRRVRVLKRNRAIYVAYKGSLTGTVRVHLDYHPKGTRSRKYLMRLDGGWTPPIEIR